MWWTVSKERCTLSIYEAPINFGRSGVPAVLDVITVLRVSPALDHDHDDYGHDYMGRR